MTFESFFSGSPVRRSTSSGEDPLLGHERYQTIRSLGRGTYGFVQLALDTNTKEKVAIKFWPRDPVYINKDVQRELHNHSKFKHPNIIQFREVFLTPTHVGLVMEYASGGDLFKKVKKSKGLSEKEARSLFQQLILAVDYCHKMGVASRDIKLENVLLSARKNPLVLKLTDFGFSKSDRDSIAKTICGTPGYMAPEVLTGSSYDAKKADVWSIGVMLFVMLYGCYPFEQLQDVLVRDINLPERPAVSEGAKDLIRKMAARNLNMRIKLEDICDHPWVAEGLAKNYMATNEEYVRVSLTQPSPQSIGDIDRILKAAGLASDQQQGERQNSSGTSSMDMLRNNGSGATSGEDMEW